MLSHLTRYIRNLVGGTLVIGGLAFGQFAHAEIVTTSVPLSPLGSEGDGGFGSSLTIRYFAMSGAVSEESSSDILPTTSAQASIGTENNHPEFGLVPLEFGLDSLDLGLSATSVTIDLNTAGEMSIGNSQLGISAFGPVVGGFSPAAKMNRFDLAGTTLSIDQGVVTYSGDGHAGSVFKGKEPRDFSVEPMTLELPAGSTIKTLEEQVDGSNYNVTVFVPLNVMETLVTEPVVVHMQVFGTLILTGTKVVPEPGTLVLLGLGAIGFIAIVARQRRAR